MQPPRVEAAVQQDLAQVTYWTKQYERAGKLYFGDEWDQDGKGVGKIKAFVKGPTDIRGLQQAVDALEDRMRVEISVVAKQRMTDEEFENFLRSATTNENSPDGVAELQDIGGDALADIYKALCVQIDF